MIDIKKLRETPEEIKNALRKKHVDPVMIDNLVSLDKEKRSLGMQLEELQAKRNKASKEMPSLSPEQREKMKPEMQFLKEQLGEIEPKVTKLEDEIKQLLLQIPNPPLESVPAGKDDSENVSIKTVGKKPEFSFAPRDHMELAKLNNMIEMEAATKMSGSRFYYLKNMAVMLEFALVHFVMNKLVKKGFTPVIPPVLVKEHAMFGTGFFPADRSEIYHVNPEDDDLYLVGTAEVPLCMMYADQVIPAEQLPLRFVGFSSCFRREAGSYGKDTAGIMRVHQFDKIEMFSFCHPDNSEAEHEMIRSIEEEIMSDLGFHFQVLNICGGDLGAPAAKKYDVEAWIPTQNKFRELTSASNCTDYQARRANVRYKDETGNHFVHTLNGTATAMARTIIAIMENYQQADGTIAVPEVLKKYMFGN
ncbi:serine--tRNA ligase [Candidatus Gracilibacteria bacterium]|nr:serine--tRNA ligase [Candidatus Gracilibacteria bacterium]